MKWIMGNHNAKGHSLWPTHCMPAYQTDSHMSPEESQSGEENSFQISIATELDNLIINNDNEHLEELVKRQNVDVNVELNEKKETALILAVKLSHIECVRVLLNCDYCKKNCLNINNCSAFDMALITTFDNRLEPRHSVCWEIIKCLMKSNAEPMCKDAMMYIVRTAFKYQDDQFLYRLISAALECSNSVMLHELLLQKLHRHQPIYVDIIDPILIDVSDFSVKLLKAAPPSEIEYIINSLVYYIESYWQSRRKKFTIFYKLIVYTIGAGWVWRPEYLYHISRSCPQLAKWLLQQMKTPPSLVHLSRVSFRQSITCSVPAAIDELPYPLPESLKKYLLIQDVDEICNSGNINLNEVSF